MSRSLWFSSTESPVFSQFEGHDSADVVIVGGGITGLVAADLLTAAGKKVIVVDMLRPGAGETGHTTAHLTSAFDRGYDTISRKISHEAATLIASASESAIEWLERRSRTLGAGRFQRVDGWLYTESGDDVESLRREHAASAAAGLRCSFVERAPLPFGNHGAVQYHDQGKFHPLEFLHALIADLQERGCRLFGDSKVVKVEDGSPCVVELDNGGRIEATDIVVATNVPVINRILLQTRLYAYRTYAIALPASNDDPDGLFFDTMSPYHYIRTQETSEGRFLIVGGEDHRTGTETETGVHFENLHRYANERFGDRQITHQWSGQVIETPDGLPYAGRNPGAGHVFVATGYAGQGFTMGTASAGLIASLVTGESHPMEKLLSPKRIELRALKRFITGNLEYPRHLLPDRLTNINVSADSVDAIPKGEGRIVKVDGKKAAAYRDEAGALHLLSTICPHLGCDVRWNQAEASWDCPCHGSRFDPLGSVRNGPARRDLDKIEP